MTFVIAGMNDIDQRCDGFLTWLDARRRDREPVLAELAAIGAAAHSIMTVTGSSPKSLDILAAAFGLAAATYSNWNSRLLISVEQSTVQEVVFSSQGKFRDKIKDYPVTDRPTAIYLLRNYLRLCMPITIEATFNTSTTLVQRSPEAAAIASMDGNVVVANVMPTRPAIIRDINAPMRRFDRGPGVISDTRIGPYEQRGMSSKDFKAVLDILGCTGSDLGRPGSSARRTLTKFLTDNGREPSDRVTNSVFIDLREISAGGKKGTCSG
jgi:hypothetical protein